MQTTTTLTTLALGATLALSWLGTGCATTRSTGDQLDDAVITARVGRRLTRDPDVPRRKIDVDTLDDEVTLRGQVPDQATRDEALEVAARTRGVQQVHDDLFVWPDDGERGKGDLGLAMKVNNRLITDPDVHAVNVDVDAQDGVITLSGGVEDAHARREAGRLALETEGVEAVVSELRVAEPRGVAKTTP